MMEGNVDKSTGEIIGGEAAPAGAQGDATENLAVECAAFAARDLLEALVLEIKLQERPWEAMTQGQQDEVIERLRKRVEDNVRKAVNLIVSDEQVTLPATVESVTFKEGVKAVLKLSRFAVGRHELADCEGSEVVVVIVDPKEYMRGTHEIKGTPDQQEISVEDAAQQAIDNAQGKKPSGDPQAEG